MKHSPLPWSIHSWSDKELLAVSSPDGDFVSETVRIGSGEKLICDCEYNNAGRGYPRPEREENKANFELIIRAVNSHHELMESLETIISVSEKECGIVWKQQYDAARSAIAKAKGEA